MSCRGGGPTEASARAEVAPEQSEHRWPRRRIGAVSRPAARTGTSRASPPTDEVRAQRRRDREVREAALRSRAASCLPSAAQPRSVSTHPIENVAISLHSGVSGRRWELSAQRAGLSSSPGPGSSGQTWWIMRGSSPVFSRCSLSLSCSCEHSRSRSFCSVRRASRAVACRSIKSFALSSALSFASSSARCLPYTLPKNNEIAKKRDDDAGSDVDRARGTIPQHARHSEDYATGCSEYGREYCGEDILVACHAGEHADDCSQRDGSDGDGCDFRKLGSGHGLRFVEILIWHRGIARVDIKGTSVTVPSIRTAR